MKISKLIINLIVSFLRDDDIDDIDDIDGVAFGINELELSEDSLLIGAFNVRRFGKKKMKDDRVVQRLYQVSNTL